MKNLKKNLRKTKNVEGIVEKFLWEKPVKQAIIKVAVTKVAVIKSAVSIFP